MTYCTNFIIKTFCQRQLQIGKSYETLHDKEIKCFLRLQVGKEKKVKNYNDIGVDRKLNDR